MDLVRTLAVTIDPTGAKAGGAQAEAAFRGVGAAAVKMEQGMGGAAKQMGVLHKSFGVLSASAASFGLVLGAAGVASFARDLIQTEVAMQRAANAMRYASGTAAEFTKNQEFVRRVTDGLGMDLLSTSAAFAKLAASAKGTSMEGAAIRNLFLATAKGATAMGLSVDETSGALNAFSQMLSKGTVAAEELRGQLGERLYGAFNLAARSMNMTTEQLNKQLAAGKILAADLLPALTREMDKAFSADAVKNATALQQEMNRLVTAWTDLKNATMNDGGGGLFEFATVSATAFLNTLREIVKLQSGANYSQPFGFAVTPEAAGRASAAMAANAAKARTGLSLEYVAPSGEANLSALRNSNLFKQSQFINPEDFSGTGKIGREGAYSPLGDFSIKFDRAEIDAAANGIGALRAEAEMLDKVNSSLDLFFGDMDKKSADAGRLSDTIKKQGDAIKDSVMTPMESYSAMVSRLDELQANGAITAETYSRAIAKAKKELKGDVSSGSFFGDFFQGATGGTGRGEKTDRNGVETFTDMFKQAKEAGADTTRALSSGFSNFFAGIIDGTESVASAFKKMAASILSDIARIIATRMIAEPIAGAIMGGLGSMFGAGRVPTGTTVGDFGSGFGSSFASTAHTGGLIGSTALSGKLVNPSVFNYAPRLHSGLKPDEFPAILQRGEEVIPKGGRGGGVSMSMPITVNVDGGKGGTPEQNQKMGAEIARQIQGMVDERIARAMMPRGILSAVRA